jgi:hypothetical protein
MKLKNALPLAAAFLAASFAQATPVTISNEDASALFGALSQIQPGLSPANVGKAAEDIWQLKALSDAFQSEQLKASRSSAKNAPAANAQPTPDQLKEADRIQANWDTFRKATLPLDLQPLTLTDDEIKESKMTPALYAPILHYLSPQPAAKK